jgi:hypothetical protein
MSLTTETAKEKQGISGTLFLSQTNSILQKNKAAGFPAASKINRFN